MVEKVGYPYINDPVLVEISHAAVKLDKWRLARQSAKSIMEHEKKIQAFFAILRIWEVRNILQSVDADDESREEEID